MKTLASLLVRKLPQTNSPKRHMRAIWLIRGQQSRSMGIWVFCRIPEQGVIIPGVAGHVDQALQLCGEQDHQHQDD